MCRIFAALTSMLKPTSIKGLLLLLLQLACIFPGKAQDQKYAVILQASSIPERNPHGYNPFGSYWDEEKDLYEGNNLHVKDHSFSAGSGIYKYMKESTQLRLRAGVIRTAVHSGWNFKDASFNYTYDAAKNEMDAYLVPGIAKTFSVNIFNYYAGIEMPVTVYGPAKVRKYYAYSSLASGDLRFSNETTGKYRNGFSAGLGAFGGFTIKIPRNFTFGPEAGFALLFSDYGSRGEFTSLTTDGYSYSEHLVFSRRYRKTGVSGLQGSLNLAWWF